MTLAVDDSEYFGTCESPMEVNVSVTVSICDLDDEDGTETGTRIVFEEPGEKTAVESPFCPRSAHPMVLEIPISKESD